MTITATGALETAKVKATVVEVLNFIKKEPQLVKIFKAARPLTENMSGDPVRAMFTGATRTAGLSLRCGAKTSGTA